MNNKNNDFFLGSPKQSKKEEQKMPETANVEEGGTLQEQLPETKKKGMTLKTIPMSLKKIRKVIDEVKDRNTPITAEEKFDLSITGSYLSYLATTVQNMISESK